MKKVTALLLAMLLLVAVCMTGCGNTAETPATTTADAPAAAEPAVVEIGDEPITLRIGTMPFGHSVPVFYAMQNGMFEDANITVETAFFAGGPAMNEAAAAGEWDVGTTGGMPAVTGALAYDYKIIAYANDDMAPNAIYARPDSDLVAAGQGNVAAAPEMYGTAETWAGKTVLCNTGSSLQYALDACLGLLGLTENDVTVVQMDCASALAAFQAGEGDLCCLWDPQRYTADDEGYIKVASLDMTDEVLPTCVVASADMVANHPDYVERFLKVYLEAQEILSKDLDLYAATFDAWEDECGTPISEENAYQSCANRVHPDNATNLSYFEGEVGQTRMDEIMLGVENFLLSAGKIEQADIDYLAAHPMVDSSFIEQAYAELHG